MTRRAALEAVKEAVNADGKGMLLGNFLEYDFGDFDETACALNGLNAHSPELCIVLIDALIAQEGQE